MLPAVQAGRRELERAADALATRLPEPLGVFARLAYNYRWAWSVDGPDVFRAIDPERWDHCAENPVRLLQEADAHRLDRVLRVRPLRPAEVRADAHLLGAPVQQQPDRRQRRADARVVGDAAALERDVQVGANEDALPADLGVTHRPRRVHLRRD